MKLKCISDRLNYIAFDESGKPHRVKPGETFQIKAKEMPKKWRGLVSVVDGPAETDEDEEGERVTVTNPENGGQPKTEPAKTAAQKPATKTQAAKTASK